MKAAALRVADQRQVAGPDEWDRIIEQVKKLPPDTRLKMAENIRMSAVEDIEVRRRELAEQLNGLESLLGPATETPTTNNTSPKRGRPAGKSNNAGSQNAGGVKAGSTADKILGVLRRRRGQFMTVNDIKQAAGTPWVTTAIGQLVQSRQIVSDGKRPAAFSLK